MQGRLVGIGTLGTAGMSKICSLDLPLAGNDRLATFWAGTVTLLSSLNLTDGDELSRTTHRKRNSHSGEIGDWKSFLKKIKGAAYKEVCQGMRHGEQDRPASHQPVFSATPIAFQFLTSQVFPALASQDLLRLLPEQRVKNQTRNRGRCDYYRFLQLLESPQN